MVQIDCNLISAGPITVAAEIHRYSAITAQPVPEQTSAAVTMFSDVIPHSATDIY
jgi:hypothetical protein